MINVINYNIKEIDNVIKKAQAIARELGKEKVAENYYTDYTYCYSYNYDSLYIYYYVEEPKRICIIINGIEVLHYDYKREKLVSFIDGKWKELIEIIYNNIEIFGFEKKAKELESERRLQEIIDLEKSIIKFIKFTDSHYSGHSNAKDATEWFDREFKYYNIRLVRRTDMVNTGVLNDQSGEFYYQEQKFCDIYYNNEKVLTFKKEWDSPCGRLRTKEGVNNYKSGKWIGIFKNVVKKFEDYRENESHRIVDDSTNNILKKLRNI